MSTQTYRTTTVGLVITLSLVLAAVGILAVGREEGLFRDRVKFRTDFPKVDGLAKGAPVKLIGVEVGVVSAISLPVEVGKQEVDVEFTVDTIYRDRIRAGTTASLRNLTYLSGEKYVELIPGDASAEVIAEGGYVDSPRSDFAELLEGSKTIADNIEEISNQFRTLLGFLTEGDSMLARLIQDPEFGRVTMDEAEQTVAGINRLVARLESGQGLVGRLLSDDALAESTLARFESVVERFESLTARVDRGEGLLGELLAEDSEMKKATTDLVEVIQGLNGVLGKIESGQGLVGRLLADPDYGRTTTERLDAILADLSSILSKVDSGDGTLARMLNDPELYDEATEVVGGLSDSRFLRWVARRMHNKDLKKKINEFADELERAERAGNVANP